MNAFWPPQITPLDILSGLNTAEAWLALADDQLIGVDALHYHHLSIWRAFLLCDPSWAPQILPELQHALQQVIFQFRYLVPESRRPAMSQVMAMLPDGSHREGLEAAYRAAGWQAPYVPPGLIHRPSPPWTERPWPISTPRPPSKASPSSACPPGPGPSGAPSCPLCRRPRRASGMNTAPGWPACTVRPLP